MDALNLCQVLGGAEHGGLERHFAELSGALAERGHRVTAIAHPRHALDLPAAVDFVPLDLARGRRNPFVLYRLARIIRERRPDLVHAQAGKAAAMLASLRRWLPGPMVATVHNIKRDQRPLRRFDAVIAVSGSVAASLRSLEASVVYNGIRPPPAPEAAVTAVLRGRFAHGGRPLALAVGRLVAAKGFDLLLDAWRGLDAGLLIAGEGPLHETLADAIRRHGLDDRVRLLGQCSEVPALMAAADLVVMPSRHEGLPYVLLEALHLRRPVVASRVAGADELLPPAWLAPPGDAAGLAAVLRRALAEPEALAADMEPAWQRAARSLTLETMAADTEAVYRRVLHG